MNSKNIWKYGFNWGSIVGAAYFLGRIIGFYLKIENSFFWGLLVSFIIVFGLGYAMLYYKRSISPKEEIKFGKYFAMGTVMSLFMSLFTTLFMLLYVTKLNTGYFSDFMSSYMKVMQGSSYGIQITDYSMIERIVKIGFIPVGYVTDFIGNLFYVLLLSWLFSSTQKRRNYTYPQNLDNEYMPYKDMKDTKPSQENNQSNSDSEDAQDEGENNNDEAKNND